MRYLSRYPQEAPGKGMLHRAIIQVSRAAHRGHLGLIGAIEIWRVPVGSNRKWSRRPRQVEL